MRCARSMLRASLFLLVAWLAGCATNIGPNSSKTVPPSIAGLPSEPVVSAAVQNEYVAALSAMKRSRYQEAEQTLLSLTRRYPDLSGPFANLGIIYHRLGKLPEAAESLNKAIEINSNRAAYHNELGIVYRESGQLEKARESYARALRVDPLYLNSHLNIGILYDLYLQEPGKALQHYERYQALLPAADAQVNKWIVDLKQRHPASDKTAFRSDR